MRKDSGSASFLVNNCINIDFHNINENKWHCCQKVYRACNISSDSALSVSMSNKYCISLKFKMQGAIVLNLNTFPVEVRAIKLN